LPSVHGFAPDPEVKFHSMRFPPWWHEPRRAAVGDAGGAGASFCRRTPPSPAFSL